MPSASVHLFVYGSLKRAGRHHDELAGATFLGVAETGPGYRLEREWLGEYLALVPDKASTEVVAGELFEVPLAKLPDLDAFEGDAYARAELPVRLLAQPERPATQAQPEPARHEPARHEPARQVTQAQAKPERHATERHEPARHEPARHEPARHETEDRGNSAETRLALAYFGKAR